MFVDLKERGLDGTSVRAGIMDGLPGLGDAFREAFPSAKVLRCWVHKARNVMPLVPRRYQAAFQASWNAVVYAESLDAARAAFDKLKTAWTKDAGDAVARMERDIDALLAHYAFPPDHWEALRTTNLPAGAVHRVGHASRAPCGKGICICSLDRQVRGPEDRVHFSVTFDRGPSRRALPRAQQPHR